MTVLGKRLWSLRQGKWAKNAIFAADSSEVGQAASVEFIQQVADFIDVPIDEFLREDSRKQARPGPTPKI